MSETRGQKLERKGRFRKAANAYEDAGMHGLAASCWWRVGECERATRSLQRASWQCNSRYKDVVAVAQHNSSTGDVLEAGEILIRFGLIDTWSDHEDNELWSDIWSHRIQQPCFDVWLRTLWTEAPDTLARGQFALELLCRASCHLSTDAARKAIRTYWENVVDAAWQRFGNDVLEPYICAAEDATSRQQTGRNREDMHIPQPESIFAVFDTDDPFVLRMAGLLADGTLTQSTRPVMIADFLLELCKKPQAAVLACNAALDRRKPGFRDLVPRWVESQRPWLLALSNAYIEAGQGEKAVRVYRDRHLYAEAAEALELLGRFEEALVLLERCGPANFRMRSWWKALQSRDYTHDYLHDQWSVAVERVKGKHACSQGSASNAAPSESPSAADELGTALADCETARERSTSSNDEHRKG